MSRARAQSSGDGMDFPRRSRMAPFAALLAVALAGCGSRQLVATPNLLQRPGGEKQFAQCPAACQAAEMDVIYATDRAIVDGDFGPAYGYGRAKRLAYGTA